MRSQETLHIDRVTGQSVSTRRFLPDAKMPQRVREMLANLPPIENPTMKAAIIKCDGCGTHAKLDFDNPQLPEGWRETSEGDFCSEC